jgi:hypothetical protein
MDSGIRDGYTLQIDHFKMKNAADSVSEPKVISIGMRGFYAFWVLTPHSQAGRAAIYYRQCCVRVGGNKLLGNCARTIVLKALLKGLHQ